MRYRIRFKRGPDTVAVIDGQRDLDLDELQLVGGANVQTTEQTLEKLTGFRVHVEEWDNNQPSIGQPSESLTR